MVTSTHYRDEAAMTPGRSNFNLFVLGVIAIIVMLFVYAAFSVMKWVQADEILFVQYPTGTLKVVTDPGPTAVWFGTTQVYKRQYLYEFDNNQQICQQADNKGAAPIRVRFAEGGHAHICGALRWEMPVKPDLVIQIQKDFGSPEAVESTLVARALVNAVFLSGQTMTSTESSAERRAELLNYVEDQVRNGVYKTVTKQTRQIDPVTKQERTVNFVEIVHDKDGKALRNNVSAIGEYGISLVQTSISEIKYEPDVEKQIQLQQKAKTDVQIAIAQALKAEQDARTVAEQGKATAAKAQWEQETIKARETTKARQEKEVAETHALKQKEVAKLERDAAEFTKQRDILLGQGESEKRRLLLAADGALTQKLEAWKAVNGFYANAIKDYKGQWVPTTVMGASSGDGSNQGMALIDLLTAKTARDLHLDMSVKK